MRSLATIVAFICAVDLAHAAENGLPYQRQENLVFHEVHGIGLLMDIFTPTGAKNGRGIVDVASGAWHSDRGKLKDHEKAQVFDMLCRRGYTVFAIRPGSISKFSALEMVDHVALGIRWVKEHAPAYAIDTTRLGLMGASAGGHLACLTAVTRGGSAGTADASVAAVGAFFPPTDFLDYGGQELDPRGDGLGEILRRLAFPNGLEKLSDEQIRQQITGISPARLVTPQAPPFLLIHGNLDFMVPLQQSQTLLAALREKQVPAELIIKQGGGHPWPTLHEELAVLADWFDKQLGVSQPPSPAAPGRG